MFAFNQECCVDFEDRRQMGKGYTNHYIVCFDNRINSCWLLENEAASIAGKATKEPKTVKTCSIATYVYVLTGTYTYVQISTSINVVQRLHSTVAQTVATVN